MIKRYDFKSTTEWKAFRAKGIGASEIASVAGFDPYTTLHEWWEKKMMAINGELEDHETKETMRGHELEDVVAKRFEKETGHKIIATSACDYISVNDEFEFAFASPDRVFWIDEDGKKSGVNSEANKGILECKTTMKRLEDESDGVNFIALNGWSCPLRWYLQVQWQLFCTGKTLGAIAVYEITSWEFHYAYIKYDENLLMNTLLPKASIAWGYIRNREEPPANTIKDVLKKYAHTSEDREVEVTDEIAKKIEMLKELKSQRLSITKREDVIGDEVRAFFADAEKLVNSEGKTLATYKCSKARVKFDEKALKADNAELYAKYLIEGKPSRTLNIK